MKDVSMMSVAMRKEVECFELEEERRRANAFATRALINDEVMRSPLHGHAWCRHMIPGRRCIACQRVVWQGGVSCPFCNGIAHRACANIRRIRPCCSLVSLEKTRNKKSSLAAMRYDSLQRAKTTRVGSLIINAVERRRGFLEKADRDRADQALTLESHRLRSAKEEKVILPISSTRTRPTTEKNESRNTRLLHGATALAGATVAGAAAGSVIAGPAGAMIGAKIAQSSVQMGALLGVAVGYRYMISEEEKEAPLFSDMAAAGRKAARRATMGRLGRGGSDEPWAAASAAAVASAQLDGLALERDLNPEEDIIELAHHIFVSSDRDHDTKDTPPHRVLQALDAIFLHFVENDHKHIDRVIDAVLRFSRVLCVEFVAYIPNLALSAHSLDATERAVDAIVFRRCYAVLFPLFTKLTQKQDFCLCAAYDIPTTAQRKVSHSAFDQARSGLLSAADTKPPLAKLELITTALRHLARAGGDEDVDADLLLPLAVDCIRAARISNLNAHLAYIEAFCHSRDFLGAQGYAVTTLRCAIAVLCNSNPAFTEKHENMIEALPLS